MDCGHFRDKHVFTVLLHIIIAYRMGLKIPYEENDMMMCVYSLVCMYPTFLSTPIDVWDAQGTIDQRRYKSTIMRPLVAVLIPACAISALILDDSTM
jgi:hypothetical protein